MRICVLQSSYEGSGSDLAEVDDEPSNLGDYTSQHTFENRLIHLKTANEEIDALVAEGFDFYINFLWGSLDDPVAGIQASQYFESLGVPSAGVRSWERSRNKNAFYENARKRGAPRVPGTKQFPLFVKPANGCASLMIDENSVCNNEDELTDALRRINKQLHPFRLQRAKALGLPDPGLRAHAESHHPATLHSDDIVIQEYIEGRDYGVTVIEMGASALALNPYVMRTKAVSQKKNILTFDLKFDPETRVELIKRNDNPTLFDQLQQAALEAFEAGMFRGSHMGCDVDFRVRPNGEVFVIEANPQPADFLPQDSNFQDLPISEGLPGGHMAVVNVFIANHFLRHGAPKGSSKVADAYDSIAHKYDGDGDTHSQDKANFEHIVKCFDFTGSVLDIACGTGFFGRILAANRSQKDYSLVGFDISEEMANICRETKIYDEVYIDGMQTCLLNYRNQDEIDHIICFGAAHFLSREGFTFFMVLCFVLAKKSITIAIDEIPDTYNEHLRQIGHGHMHSVNHLETMEGFKEPRGWRLVNRQRQYSWTSPTTGDDVFSTFFRFERTDEKDIKILKYLEAK
ncbi:uncharacterized protein BDW47DRAFT_133789 [Aspergillus candidus]|uniref:ATP-grasp domain-containing protein n=1 Tax=Aspergillus candidus TaxID=41067 RepID=A0A2I2F3J6_ASPCN|nr:hypothetical protein BDW47DRAFT_133789 [Aspergillus candidus]PLB35189.1 hypothetical protein BDW47DRAFT_133789 [Aspergillus candidus]